MAARQERIDAFIHEGSPPADQPLEILCEDHVGTYVIPPTYRSRGDRLAGTKTKSALNLEVLSRSFAPVRDFLVFDDLPLIETAEAGSFDRRDVDKHISAAATLRLNEPIALGRIEPLHGAFRHYLLQAIFASRHDHSKPEKKNGVRRRPVSTGRPAGGEAVGHLRRCPIGTTRAKKSRPKPRSSFIAGASFEVAAALAWWI